ncbi:MAG: TolB family protein, partial [Gemmatimonadota bacterium]
MPLSLSIASPARIRLAAFAAFAALAAPLLVPAALGAQWSNRYPKNAGYGHHVYLEGYELPVLSAGVFDAAQSPAGELVVASRGWLWRLDASTGIARRLTSGGGVDSRPAWSPDARSLAFVRDDSRTLAVVVRDMASGRETEIDRGMAMDPVFTPDGSAVLYANVAPGGDLDLWRWDVATSARTRLTSEAGIELRPQVAPDGKSLVYLSKSRAGGNQVRLRTLADGKETVLLQGNIVSQTRPALSPDGKLLAFTWPATNGWELRLMSVERPGPSILLVSRPGGRPLVPSWSFGGDWIYFSESNERQVPHLYRVPAVGGQVERVAVRSWETGAPMGRLVVETRCASCGAATFTGA